MRNHQVSFQIVHENKLFTGFSGNTSSHIKFLKVCLFMYDFIVPSHWKLIVLCVFWIFWIRVCCMFFFLLMHARGPPLHECWHVNTSLKNIYTYTACMTDDVKDSPTRAWPGQQSKQRLLQVWIPQQREGTRMSHTSQNPPPCRSLAPAKTSRKQPTLPERGRIKGWWKITTPTTTKPIETPRFPQFW